MRRTFNLGIGMVVIVEPSAAQAVADALRDGDEEVHIIGAITAAAP